MLFLERGGVYFSNLEWIVWDLALGGTWLGRTWRWAGLGRTWRWAGLGWAGLALGGTWLGRTAAGQDLAGPDVALGGTWLGRTWRCWCSPLRVGRLARGASSRAPKIARKPTRAWESLPAAGRTALCGAVLADEGSQPAITARRVSPHTGLRGSLKPSPAGAPCLVQPAMLAVQSVSLHSAHGRHFSHSARSRCVQGK
jgi:hypothetical protein